MRTITPTYKCDTDKCPYDQICIDSTVEHDIENNWICPHLNLYNNQPPQHALPECLHRQHTCQECKQDHTTDYTFCQSPKRQQQ